MPAPSKNFNTIPDSDIDPESPLTTGLMTSIRDALINVDEQVSYGFVRAQAHDHNGTNSVLLSGNIFGNLFAYQNYV